MNQTQNKIRFSLETVGTGYHVKCVVSVPEHEKENAHDLRFEQVFLQYDAADAWIREKIADFV